MRIEDIDLWFVEQSIDEKLVILAINVGFEDINEVRNLTKEDMLNLVFHYEKNIDDSTYLDYWFAYNDIDKQYCYWIYNEPTDKFEDFLEY